MNDGEKLNIDVSKEPTWTINFIDVVKFPIANVADVPNPGATEDDLSAGWASLRPRQHLDDCLIQAGAR